MALMVACLHPPAASPRDLASIRDTLATVQLLGCLLLTQDHVGMQRVADKAEGSGGVATAAASTTQAYADRVSALLSRFQSAGERQPSTLVAMATSDYDRACDAMGTEGDGGSWAALPGILKGISVALLQPLDSSDALAGDLATAYTTLKQAIVDDPPNYVMSSATGAMLRVCCCVRAENSCPLPAQFMFLRPTGRACNCAEPYGDAAHGLRAPRLQRQPGRDVPPSR